MTFWEPHSTPGRSLDATKGGLLSKRPFPMFPESGTREDHGGREQWGCESRRNFKVPWPKCLRFNAFVKARAGRGRLWSKNPDGH